MRTYSLYIEDDRYSVPTLQFVTAGDDAEIRRLAEAMLAKPHHQSVEVREGDVVLFRLAAEMSEARRLA
jgi:hypothetical protein